MYAIEVENLHKKYRQILQGEIHALKGVSLQVKPGEVFGILGPNGAGKTTLVRILLSIIKPTSGSARIFDSKYNATNVKTKLAYLAENHTYPRYLTGEQVLQYFGSLSGVHGKKLRDKIDETLELVGMTKWRKTKVKKYSKGMTQRIGLAQTLINDSELLFLDEPTDGIDALGRKEIRDLLLKLKEQGKTIFLNSHLLSEVEQICDQIVIMNKGEIIRRGTIDSLVAKRNAYKIDVVGATETSVASLKEKVQSIASVDNQIHVTVKEVEELDLIIDTLRSNSVSIRSIIPDRQSLEDYFVDVIGKDGDK
ncbi:ABC transporter ATP-binding protein [Candidatus Uabimicrobium amorphum]|uniref:ABC transporter ATP-binding protein n=1 Tax=Uabimicrobium amorphum TaxID=2596890 RepID=A0A5S9F3A7_UABAM|nr:ABC transporter ATP-binding protein [Candidatus Uabimicrobium amorphum]BBM84302.1 ABC transporter ATP-binding protein [Candidatus Uabimicrobium amorphum]